MQPQRLSCDACPILGLGACANIGDQDIDRLEELRAVETIAAGEALFEEGDPATHVYSVISGCIRTYKMLPDGRRQITGFALAGGLLGLTFEDRHDHSAEAISDTRVCHLTRAGLMELMDDHHVLERRFLLILGQQLAAAQNQMLLLGRKTPLEKLASLLCSLALRMSSDGKIASTIRLPMSRSDIADYLGLTIETVSRSFSRLRAEGVIDLPGPDLVHMRDRTRLEDLANLPRA